MVFRIVQTQQPETGNALVDKPTVILYTYSYKLCLHLSRCCYYTNYRHIEAHYSLLGRTAGMAANNRRLGFVPRSVPRSSPIGGLR